MDFLPSLAAYLKAPDSRPVAEIDQEIREELEFHLEMTVRERVASGLTPRAAQAAAVAEFGDVERIRRSCRRIRVGDRIMLQRLHACLTIVLLGFATFLGWRLHAQQQASIAELAEIKGALAGISSRMAAVAHASGPVVVATQPPTGATEVDPGIDGIRVQFDRRMLDGNWSWVRSDEGSFPETRGDSHFLSDGKTCVMPVKLEKGVKYVVWINSAHHRNFMDIAARPATPYRLEFQTRK